MSLPSKHVVAGVDGSDASIALLDWATRYAATIGADLTVVSACPVPTSSEPRPGGDQGDPQAGLARRLDDLVHQTCTGVTHRVVLGNGAPAPLLLREAEGADLLVIGKHTGRGLPMSRVAQAVLLEASCPVVVLPVS
jgi:nucleotide-binding universal stress UspA family protein